MADVWPSVTFQLALPLGEFRQGTFPMIRQEQYEIWVQSSLNKWNMLGCFPDLDLASTIAKSRSARTRLVCVTFEYGKMISQESIAELGTPRNPNDRDIGSSGHRVI